MEGEFVGKRDNPFGDMFGDMFGDSGKPKPEFEGTGNIIADNPIRVIQTGAWKCIQCDQLNNADQKFCGCASPKEWSFPI